MGTGIADRTLHTTWFVHRPNYLRSSYYDRPDLIAHRPHHVYSYYNPYRRLSYRIVSPSYYYWVGYPFGPHYHYRYVYPYYHRKYVFISLGGYWPMDYSYVRYYWYGWHPYVWYGYYPIATEVPGDTYNYYTYNYYDSDGTATTSETGYADPATFADVRAKLEQQRAEPSPQTMADTRFEEGVKSFESGDYAAAAEKFALAMQLSPDDMILPFAYAQALFANGQYSTATGVLRDALKNVSPEKESVFYPRGLYASDDVLFKQIEGLVDRIEQSDAESNSDLQLLLGYHLLGTGETGYAREPLERAAQDPKNAEAAATLLQLAEKIEKEAGTTDKAGSEPQTTSGTPGASVAPIVPGQNAPLSSTEQGPAVEETLKAGEAGIVDLAGASKQDSALQRTPGDTALPAQEQSANREDDDEL